MLSLTVLSDAATGKANKGRKAKAKGDDVIFSRKHALALARLIAGAHSLEHALEMIDGALSRMGNRGDWSTAWRRVGFRLLDWFRSGRARGEEAPFQIINAEGNTKLHMAEFSVLPIVTCPGRGACESFCYSVKAWQYPEAYWRQVQNTLLMRFCPEHVRLAFCRLPSGSWFRLYVDGDFSCQSDVAFWMELLSLRPDVHCWGYSKSWREILSFSRQEGAFPDNYALNLSSGGNSPELLQQMMALPCTRERFLALPITGEHPRGFARFDSEEWARDLRESARGAGLPKAFVCRGRCHECSTAGPVCGIKSARIPVVIDVH